MASCEKKHVSHASAQSKFFFSSAVYVRSTIVNLNLDVSKFFSCCVEMTDLNCTCYYFENLNC